MQKKMTVIVILGVYILVLSIYAFYSIIYPVKYKDIISAESIKNNLSTPLVASVINVESSYKKEAISPVGAKGLMQILPSTFQYVCELNDIDFDENKMAQPDYNIQIGCLYLKYLFNKFENTQTVLCAYNAGETIVRSWLNNARYSSDGKTLFNIPFEETNNYLNKINKNIKYYKKIYKNTYNA